MGHVIFVVLHVGAGLGVPLFNRPSTFDWDYLAEDFEQGGFPRPVGSHQHDALVESRAAGGDDRANFTSRALILTARQVGDSFYLSQYEARQT